MGQFSWITQDTNEPIYNDWEEFGDRQTIHMVDPRDGTDYKEEGYEGYGIFGGLDFYCLLVDINKDFITKSFLKNPDKETLDALAKDNKDLTDEDVRIKRNIGIDFWYTYFENCSPFGMSPVEALSKRLDHNIMSPILVVDYNTWKMLAKPKHYPSSDPNQGWHSIEDEEDDEDEI